jgi:ABC-2 type transport system ATP-binding protein
MRRRLDLASALVHDPKVLFLDEPTTGLDPVSRLTIWEEVRKLNDEGTTVFLTTQYLEEADQLADRVGIIDDGRMAAEGTPAELKAQIGYSHLELTIADGAADRAAQVIARFGEPLPSQDGVLMLGLERGARDIAPIVRALDEAGLSVESLNLVHPTLDDVFVAKTGRHLEGAHNGQGEEGVGDAAPQQAEAPGA